MENIKSCRLCKNTSIKEIIPFGDVALANSYPVSISEKEDLYPLTLVKCDSCGHVQIRETVSPEKLFSNYLYSSSDSPALVKHFKEFVQNIKNRSLSNHEPTILEIGSNDGILLKEFREIKYGRLIGIDPAQNLSEKAKSIEGINVIVDFFNLSSSERIKNEFGPIDIICGNNVFAHIDQLDSVVEGITNCLAKDGVFIFENAYLLDTIKGLYFDQVYHEHLQYYGIIPLRNYLRNFGLEIFDIERVQTQGGSFRIFTKRIESSRHSITDNVLDFIDREIEFGLYEDKTYVRFVDKLNLLKKDIKNLIDSIKSENKTVSCYGCPAKFSLFSNFFDLSKDDIKYVVDDSPLKQGRFSPGKKIPIVGRKYFYDNPTDYCIVSVWNMAEAIINNNKEYKGKFIIPMPELKII